MNEKNNISSVTRQNIADETELSRIPYEGRLDEVTFLSRMFNLQKLPSNDYRYRTAYHDIHQHRVRNNDWANNWMYSDPRINLLHCDDALYLRFLAETLHPTVRPTQEDVDKLLEIYNRHLAADNFEIVQEGDISGKPVFVGRMKGLGNAHFISQKNEIKKYLNTNYVQSKLSIMKDALDKHNTDLAIGTAKELLETTCKSILKQKGVTIGTDWTLPRLTNETTQNIDFGFEKTEDITKAEKSIKQVLSGISTTIHGMAELRNAYGSGHGKDADFTGLPIHYAKFLVGVVSDIVIFYLSLNGEKAELVENNTGGECDR